MNLFSPVLIYDDCNTQFHVLYLETERIIALFIPSQSQEQISKIDYKVPRGLLGHFNEDMRKIKEQLIAIFISRNMAVPVGTGRKKKMEASGTSEH